LRAAEPEAVAVVTTPFVVDETVVSCTLRNATVKICTLAVSEGWLKLADTVTGWVPSAGFGEINTIVVFSNGVTVFVGVKVLVGVKVGFATVTIAPVSMLPVNITGPVALEPAKAVEGVMVAW